MPERIRMEKKYRTRGGSKVELLSINGRDPYPVVGFVGTDDQPQCWMATGKYNMLQDWESLLDLIEDTEGDE